MSFPLRASSRPRLDVLGWASGPVLVLCRPLLGCWARMGAEFWHKFFHPACPFFSCIWATGQVECLGPSQMLPARRQAGVCEPFKFLNLGSELRRNNIFSCQTLPLGQGLSPAVLWPWLVCYESANFKSQTVNIFDNVDHMVWATYHPVLRSQRASTQRQCANLWLRRHPDKPSLGTLKCGC